MESLVQVLVYLFSTEIVKPIFSTVLATIIGNLMKGKEIPMTEERRKRLENKRKIYKKLYYQFCVDPFTAKTYLFYETKEKIFNFFNNEYKGNEFLYDMFSTELQQLFWEFIKNTTDSDFKNIQEQIKYEYRDLCIKLEYGTLPELGVKRKYTHSEKFTLSGNFCILFSFFSVVFSNKKTISTISLSIALILGGYTFYEYFRFLKKIN